MAGVILDQADMALFSDPGATLVRIPHLLRADRNRSLASTLVTFEGDAYPTGFRGEQRSRVYDMVARYGPTEHQEMADLLALVEDAHDAPDGRIQFRHNGFVETPELGPYEVVLVTDLAERHLGRRGWDVTLTVQTVNYSLSG